MTPAERQAVVVAAECCEYHCGMAFAAAEEGRLQSAEEALDWAELASLSAFFVASNAA